MGAGSSTSAGKGPWGIVVALGFTQIIAWGSVYYSFALLLGPLQATLVASKSAIVGAFSLALLVSGVSGPFVGRLIDRHGGRGVMAIGSAVASIALACLSQVTTLPGLYAVYVVLGVAMAATLYDPAFAVLSRAFATDYRKAITALTLFGGLASTVFWPLTSQLIARFGWRDALLVLAALQLVVCMPLHLMALPKGRPTAPVMGGPAPGPGPSHIWRDPTFYFLCLAFTANALVFSSMSVHMISMLIAKGQSAVNAALIGAMVGPMQLAGRVMEISFGHRVSRARVAMMALGMQPVALLVFLLAGPTLAVFVLFALLYGAGNGVMTIVRGTVPAELYGRTHYGAINGAMAAPVLVAQAGGPLAVAWVYSCMGGYGAVLLCLLGAGVLALMAFAVAVRRSHAVLSQVNAR